MEESLQTRLPIYPLLTLTSILGSYLFMEWTAHNGLAPLVRLLYDQQQIKTFSQELLIVVNTAYYFSLIVIVAYAAAEFYHMIYKFISKAQSEPEFTSTTKHSLTVSFHTFIIFIAFFYFLLRNDGDDLSKRYINLLPFWFLSSTVVYLIGSWTAKWAKVRLSVVGVIINLIVWFLIAGEIYQSGFIKAVFHL